MPPLVSFTTLFVLEALTHVGSAVPLMAKMAVTAPITRTAKKCQAMSRVGSGGCACTTMKLTQSMKQKIIQKQRDKMLNVFTSCTLTP